MCCTCACTCQASVGVSRHGGGGGTGPGAALNGRRNRVALSSPRTDPRGVRGRRLSSSGFGAVPRDRDHPDRDRDRPDRDRDRPGQGVTLTPRAVRVFFRARTPFSQSPSWQKRLFSFGTSAIGETSTPRASMEMRVRLSWGRPSGWSSWLRSSSRSRRAPRATVLSAGIVRFFGRHKTGCGAIGGPRSYGVLRPVVYRLAAK